MGRFCNLLIFSPTVFLTKLWMPIRSVVVVVYTSYLYADVLFTLATRHKHYQMKPLDMVIKSSQLSIHVTEAE
jgi:hypothetical protein